MTEPVQTQTTNGFAVASLVLGIVAAVFGLIPLLSVIALIAGILAVIFGVVGLRRAQAGGGHRGMARAGLVTGIVGIILAIIGMVIINEAIEDVDRELQKLEEIQP